MGEQPPPLSEADRVLATVLAVSVRNALEGTLHGGELGTLSLTDEQMRLLNPLVRDAVATALHARSNYHRCRPARAYLDFQERLIPDYWEPAQLLPEYVDDWHALAARDDGYQVACRRCGRAIVNPSGSRWTHLSSDGGLNVGCRAASFTSDEGWDDTLARSWRASPRPEDANPGRGQGSP